MMTDQQKRRAGMWVFFTFVAVVWVCCWGSGVFTGWMVSH